MKVSRLILVGQAQNRRGDPPLLGRVGNRMRDLLGISADRYLDLERCNLLERWPGRRGPKGDRFPRTTAARIAGTMLDILDAESPAPVVILAVGIAVGRAFGTDVRTLFNRQRMRPRVCVAVMPHASGTCRWWNEKVNVTKARRALRRLARSLGVVG